MPFIQTGSVSNCEDFIREYHQTYSEFGIQQSKVWPSNTLCITIAANIAKTGILTFEACFPDSVVGLVPASGVNVYYLHLWMQNIQARLEAFAPATAQKNINLEVLNAVAVPLPPTQEQAAIVHAYKSAVEDMKDASTFVEDSGQRGFLRQSILKAAFEGRLAAQDPRDEPADSLLARLSEQAETRQPQQRRQKRRTALAAE
jgi:type I restriction enzyme S subunit